MNLDSPFRSNKIRRNSMSYNQLEEIEMGTFENNENRFQIEVEPTIRRRNHINDSVINILNNNIDIELLERDHLNEKIYNYKITILGYLYYCLLCLGMPSFLNAVTLGETRLNADLLFNFYASPFIYKVCFRQHFLYYYKNNKKNLFFYLLFYILGFCIRFLDKIDGLQTFVLNTEVFNYNNKAHLVLFWLVIIYLLTTFIYEIRSTVCWKINIGLLFLGMFFVYISLNEFVKNGIVYHFHHFFVGLILHIVCQRKTRISFFNNAIGFGVYIEGIALWGFGRIIYK